MKKIISLLFVFIILVFGLNISFAEEKCNFLLDKKVLNLKKENSYSRTNLFFSPNGKSFYYIYKNGNKYELIKDGKKIDEGDFINDFKYSLGGKSYAYVVNKGKEYILLKDGKEIDRGSGIYDFKYSLTGNHFAYSILKNQKLILYKDGKEIYNFPPFTNLSFGFSKNGVDFLIFYFKDGKYYLEKNGVKNILPYEGILSVIFSNNSEKYIIKLRELFKEYVIVNGKKEKKYDSILDIFRYSPDGKSYAYTASNNKVDILIKDGKEIDSGDFIVDFKYSPDGKSYAYVIQKGNKYILVKDGKKIDSGNEVINFIYSYNSKDFAYIIHKFDKYLLMKNGKLLVAKDFLYNLSFIGNSVDLIYAEGKDNYFYFYKSNCNSNKKGKIEIIKKLVATKHKLLKNKALSKYISRVDLFVRNTDIKKLEKVLGKLNTLDLENGKFKKISILVKYFKLKIELKLIDKENDKVTKNNISKSSTKLNDIKRINDIKKIQLSLDLYYSDYAEYPENINDLERKMYIKKIPEDKLKGKVINGCKFGYKYEVGDINGVKNQAFRLSTCFENNDNIVKKAKNDGGIYDNRWEVGNMK